MQMLKPYMGALRRSYNPGLWLNYRMSKHHKSLHAKVQRIQVCSSGRDWFANLELKVGGVVLMSGA